MNGRSSKVTSAPARQARETTSQSIRTVSAGTGSAAASVAAR
jgi:hypothetical protein